METKKEDISKKFDVKADIVQIHEEKLNSTNLKEEEKQGILETKNAVNENIYLCQKDMTKLNLGALCYIASGIATEKTTIENGVVTVKVKTSEIKDNAQVCLNVFDGICNAINEVEGNSQSDVDCQKFK